MIIKIIVLFLILTVPLLAIPLNKSLVIDITQTYSYCKAQIYVLEAIKDKFPNLEKKVFITKSQFDSSFSSSLKNIDKIMNQYKDWKDYKLKTNKTLKNSFDFSDMTYKNAIIFIDTVKARAKGKIESPVLETLLMFNPEYEKHPETEFNDGFIKKYKCDDLKKSKGVDFSIDIPMSWASKKANRPNIVRKFISYNGNGLVMAMIAIYNLEESVSKDDIKNTVNKKIIETLLPPNAKLIDYGYTELETLPGYWQRYSLSAHRLKYSISFEALSYTFFYKNKMIQIQFQVGDFKNKNLKEKFNKYKLLFDSIINSFVLLDLYK